MASAKKSSSSNGLSTSAKRVSSSRAKRNRAATPVAAPHGKFAICVRNDGYEASLELRKLYPVLEDEFGSQHGLIRVVDESREDYLFPNQYFIRVDLPQAVEKKLRKIA